MKPANGNGGAGKRATSDGLGSNSEIGRKLKQYYDDLVTEEVPDRFADLLKQLEKRETEGGAATVEKD